MDFAFDMILFENILQVPNSFSKNQIENTDYKLVLFLMIFG